VNPTDTTQTAAAPRKRFGIDTFDFETRYVPGLLALGPFAVLGVTLGLNRNEIILTLLGIAPLIGFPKLIANFARDVGYAREEPLFASWGGKPTTRMLRLADDTVDPNDKAWWRQNLADLADITFPPAVEDETTDPVAADQLYERAVSTARIRFKNDTLVDGENRNYNFQRSLLGLRPYGIALSVIAIAILAAAVAIEGIASLAGSLGIGLGATVLLLGVWVLAPSERRTRLMADKYARQLLITAASA
jgi:hypothetical protein